mmetsp:Transcript_8431/g.25521  ORF Transcript_8431/g.25521 Transcript_8431/m.25521 type:complete len:216 (-) Transcript_8431:1056-1703(-)
MKLGTLDPAEAAHNHQSVRGSLGVKEGDGLISEGAGKEGEEHGLTRYTLIVGADPYELLLKAVGHLNFHVSTNGSTLPLLVRHGNSDRPLEAELDEVVNLGPHGGAKEHRLTLGGAGFDDLVDLILEAKVEESVTLIEDKELNVVEVHTLTVGDVVKETAWSGHNNVRSSAELGRLRQRVLGPSHHKRRREICELGQRRHHSDTLRSQLPGRCQN